MGAYLNVLETVYDEPTVDEPEALLGRGTSGLVGPVLPAKLFNAVFDAAIDTALATGTINPFVGMARDAGGNIGAYYIDGLRRNIENFRYGTDPIGDDTNMLDRASQASKQYGWVITCKQGALRVSSWKWYSKMRFVGCGSSLTTGTRVIQLTGASGPLVTLDNGPVINVEVRGIGFDANLANGPQIGLMWQAKPVAPDNNGGLWWSRLDDVAVRGFRLGIWSRGGSDGLTPNQFIFATGVRVWRVGDATELELATGLLMTGQHGQIVWDGACEFDGPGGIRKGVNVQVRPEFTTDEAELGYWDWLGATAPTLIAGAWSPGYVDFRPGSTMQNAKMAIVFYKAGINRVGAWTENVDRSYVFRGNARSNIITGALATNGSLDWTIELESGCTLHIAGLKVQGEFGLLFSAGNANQGVTGLETVHRLADMQAATTGLTRQRGTPTAGTLAADGNTFLAVNSTTTPITYIESWLTWNVELVLRAYDSDVPFGPGGNIAMPLDAAGNEIGLLVLHKGELMTLVRDDFAGHKFRIKAIVRIPKLAAAAPAAGQWAIGEFVVNSAPVIDANGAYVKQWNRVTNWTSAANNNALLVDWFPEVAFTASFAHA
ncbi:hypothetical protein HDIA_2285 [Hartmannibacter diazotrophicus]|uniref:Uncharacterized protein n=1 Tax=Hartmannibacter diazotrophicus TaxID=1482074 RepID=A0A2C9D6A4_9HYPH|nr:hypothetical protein [Hartmannibacter diazotrophicus]SON55826.1 hypothetical protein HDIA_2285 [Hartmannibacter diazotrophicus]